MPCDAHLLFCPCYCCCRRRHLRRLCRRLCLCCRQVAYADRHVELGLQLALEDRNARRAIAAAGAEARTAWEARSGGGDLHTEAQVGNLAVGAWLVGWLVVAGGRGGREG